MATTGELRAKLNTQLNDQELVAFCTDHFPVVYNQFTAGMTKSQQIQLLLDYTFRRGQLDELERLIEEFLRKRDELPVTGGATAAPAAYVELEIGLHRRGDNGYEVGLQLRDSDSDAEDRETTQAQIDLDSLRAISNPVKYGQSLGESLFRVTEIVRYYERARTRATERDVPLRFRLFIGQSAPELHTLWWETLRVPGERTPLSTRQQILFSRYLETESTQKVKPLSGPEYLRALLAVSNPTNLDEYKPGGYKLAPIDVDGEIARTQQALGNRVKPLSSQGSATINNLVSELRVGNQHILYLVAHGKQIDGQSYIWLEDEKGCVQVVTADDLVDRLYDLRHRPLLAVLASCQSAGSSLSVANGSEGEKDSVLVTLGPMLADIGIPAVLAMQGNITMDTVAQFMPLFFEELQRTGEIDHAVAVARGSVRDRHDWWMPVLFMSMKSGRLWEHTGMGTGTTGTTGTGQAKPTTTTIGAGAGGDTGDDEERKELQEQLEKNKRRLHKLKMQEASFGTYTPPHISLEIDDVEKTIADLKRQLGTT